MEMMTHLTWMDKVTCVWDAVAVAGYAIMTLLVYLSLMVPFLTDLASHGKTRTSTSTPPKNSTAKISGKKNFASSFIHWFNHSEVFLVKKKHFRQFYVVAIICFTTMLYRLIVMNHLQLPMQPRTVFSSRNPPPLRSPYEKVFAVSTGLLYLHFVRRLYECTYVHKWKETSVMHIAGYLVGVIHYIWLPHIFIRLPCERCWESMFPQFYPSVLFPTRATSLGSPYLRSNLTAYNMGQFIGIGLCIYGQYQQHRHHVLLANLRKPSAKAESSVKSGQYSLPTDGWFQFVTCPHYLAEILIYASFTILLELEKPTPYYGYRHYLVLTWVASNLTLSALINHRWYQKNLPPTVMAGKKAILPFLL
jgi:3-oxo-5-alpha-steroid 4-dehydrogenase 3 / polyprenol reductase